MIGKVNNKLIFDIGFHLGQDTEFYLKLGYKVIAVEAEPKLIVEGKERFEEFTKTAQLTLLNVMVSNKLEPQFFYKSESSAWNSANNYVATRNNSKTEKILVETISLDKLMLKYGVPYYCKIDIEGNDLESLQSLKSLKEMPNYISVEAECLGDNQEITEQEILATLKALNDLGYSQFQLIDQRTLSPLQLNQKFYLSNNINMIPQKIFRKIKQLTHCTPRNKLSKKHKHNFPFGASGLFGQQLDDNWYNFETAKRLILAHRKDYFNQPHAVKYGFWCDWHAKYDGF